MVAIFESPKVSVCMITYNHAPYIAQAIESVLMQETDFPVELVIGEDCSTDNTRAIVREYGERYPDRIRLLLPEHNLGMIPNFVATMDACNGQYIALLEGDDYWTDPLKLQKQVDFLEAHSEYVGCFHDVWVEYETPEHKSHVFNLPAKKKEFGIEDVFRSTVTQTCSLMLRSGVVPTLPDWFFKAPIGDWALVFLYAEHGSIRYLNELMGVYRKHSGGVWSGITPVDQSKQRIIMYDLFVNHLGGGYRDVAEMETAICHYNLAVDCFLRGATEEAQRWMLLVTGSFTKISDRLHSESLALAHKIAETLGSINSERVLAWTIENVVTKRADRIWARELWGEWYAGLAYIAHLKGDNRGVCLMTVRAISRDCSLVGNRGLLSRWVQAVLGVKNDRP